MPVDYEAATDLIDRIFAEVEADLSNGIQPPAPPEAREAFDIVFSSNTQAYREVFVGCLVARIQDKKIDIRLPYMKHGPRAYNGRTLDKKVINPFLQRNRVPCSRAPFLSTFRRGVRFDESTRAGLRDQPGYAALLRLIAAVKNTSNDDELLGYLRYLLFKFAQLREAAVIPLSRLQRISLEQYDGLISGLLRVPSGGRLPVLLVLATFRAIKEYFGLDWHIETQGINVADAAAGAAGDVTIRHGGELVLAAEITERPVDRNRVAATFNTKIAPNGIEDYLFFVRLAGIDADAMAQARQYFVQGHEVNFLEIKDWILMSLATMGHRGRDLFNVRLIELVDAPDIPRTIKVGWNEQIQRLVGG